MSHCDDLNLARRRLFEGLGEATGQYCHLMKLWFSMKITKEEFDLEARKLMTIEQTHLHNQFLLSLFGKCKNLALDSGKSRCNERKPFYNGPKTFGGKEGIQITEESYRYCSEEFFLPDHSLLHGRLMLTAWEMGMEGAEDSAADLLFHAVQIFLKNLLTTVLTQRSGYRLRERRMIYSIGSPVPNPWLRNSGGVNNEKSESKNTEVLKGEYYYLHVPKIPLTQEEIERREVFRLACANSAIPPPLKPPVSAYDVFQALSVHKSVISSHSVYAVNMDKIISALHHPSHEEMETVRFLKRSRQLDLDDGFKPVPKLDDEIYRWEMSF